MSAFRRVEGREAGPAALGVLAPPGRRTFLILRPRALPWDLVLLRPAHPSIFCEMDRDEAAAAAGEVCPRPGGVGGRRAGPRRDGRSAAGAGSLGPRPRRDVRAPALPAHAGQPYQALRFADAESARAAAAVIAPVLHPPPGAQQELYFNTRHFLR